MIGLLVMIVLGVRPVACTNTEPAHCVYESTSPAVKVRPVVIVRGPADWTGEGWRR